MRSRWVIAITVVAGLLVGFPGVAIADAQSSPAPAATGAPLKTIIEVRSTVLCQTLREGVRPTLAGLIKNDSLIETANRAVAKMFDDQAKQATDAEQIDRLYLHNVAGALSHNLTTIAQILGHGFPQDTTPMHASEEDIHSRLQTIASAQNDALNLIEGYLQTEDVGRAQGEFVGGHQSGANEVATGSLHAAVMPNLDMQGFRAEFHNADDPTTPFIDKAGLGGGMYHPPPRIPDQAVNLPALIHLTRTRISDLEVSASPSIIAAAKVCDSPQ